MGQGRFVSRDPFAGYLSQPSTLNAYAYALNNPVTLTDPSGENPLIFLAVGTLGGLIGGASYGYGSQVASNLSRGMCFWDALTTNIDAGQVALYAGLGTVMGLGIGVGYASTYALLIRLGILSVPTIDFLESQLPRINHILQEKHAWNLLTRLSGNLLQDYRAIQPFIRQAMQTVGEQIASTSQGPIMQFKTTINGQQVVVNALKLVDGTYRIVDAWIKTR